MSLLLATIARAHAGIGKLASAMQVLKFVTHSFRVQNLAKREGWLPGARYTNLRDVRRFEQLGFLDIDWKNYKFHVHLKAAKVTQPKMTIARDVEDISMLNDILIEAHELSNHCEKVIVVPKDPRLSDILETVIPPKFVLGFSVPTRYGETKISSSSFQRQVHLLGGRPDVQRRLADELNVLSIDCNRFTIDAAYGDYFDGERFRPHPTGGYERCLLDSIRNINAIWENYSPKKHQTA